MRVGHLKKLLADHDDDQLVLIASDRTQHHVDDVVDAQSNYADDEFVVYIIEGSQPMEQPYAPGEVR